MLAQSVIIPLTVDEVYTTGRRKINPRTGEVLEDAVSNRPIFKAVAVEPWTKEKKTVTVGEETKDETGRAAARARKQLFELAVCNEFDLFVTLTLDKNEIDRYNYKGVVRKLGIWLDNLVRRHGFAYILVPEKHKDGALHFHGLVRKNGLKLVDSGHKDKKGRTVLNVANWRYGFTTAVKLDGEYEHVCKYITKYIGKDMTAGTIGGRYFFHGGELQNAQCVYYNADWRKEEGERVDIDEAGLTIIYKN